MARRFPLPELPPELLCLVARALLRDDPQADAQAVGCLAASSKALRQLVRGSAAMVAEMQAARKMLTLQRQHELFVAAGRLGADAAFPFDPSDYKQVAQQLPAPKTTLTVLFYQWGAAARERGRVVARLPRVSDSLTYLNLKGCGIGDEGAKALAAGVASSSSLVKLSLGHSEIGGEGVKAIAEAVRVSGSMAYLELKWNFRMGDAAKQSLRDAVRGRQGFELEL